MPILQTDDWLRKSYNDPIKLCENFLPYFTNSTPQEIHYHLSMSGMYRRPSTSNEKIVDSLHAIHAWDVIEKEKERLQSLWDGPDVPIFILPVDDQNRLMLRKFHGKSGITYADKVFLFISKENSKEGLRALFTHEYNHACRMQRFKKNEANYRLLDSVIMEGLAEHAVEEQVGKDFTADWTSYYSEKQLQQFWKRWIEPNRDLPKFKREHNDLLFGARFYPSMLGYCVGYYLVKKYAQAKQLSAKKLLCIPSREIAENV
ncbi:DUF2268 domain-containing protein [Virgibacillus sp. 179-BFC.A HS]|uniref:DUF2268 domain-containing protein n=1 Tax=Tigheibacillus jepli TaxID=3035914 RepID=A0ABU5CJR8_9BACI|nr:DUF2268 domain-containing protein [Virgibacillus sp. 179-BFC.A HS]MDY0406092.1 DUF2268 domain-containing protein [Virgibacillus sp. 179-BFC.A HS]